MFFLGEIYVDLPLPLTDEVNEHCGQCDACIRACPTNIDVPTFIRKISTDNVTGAAVTLYPQADPEAVWRFDADRVVYEPSTQETTLQSIADAARTVGGKTDFTLASERLTIDTQEDIRGEQIEVYVPDVRWTLDMRALEGRPVLLDQQQGRFDAPAIEITDGDGQNVSTSRNLSMNFDLTDVRTGGEGTQNNDSFRYQAD